MTLARVIEFAPKPDPGEALIPPLHFMQAAGECADEHGSGTAVDWAGLPLHGLYVTQTVGAKGCRGSRLRPWCSGP